MVVGGVGKFHRLVAVRSRSPRHSKTHHFGLASKDSRDGWSSWIEKNPLPTQRQTSGEWGSQSADSIKSLHTEPHRSPVNIASNLSSETRFFFPATDTAAILTKYGEQLGISWVAEEQRWMNESCRCQIILPRILEKPADSISWQEYASNLEEHGLGLQLLVFVSAESVALGLIDEGTLSRHKVLKGYTVRKSQGRAQLTHERRKDGGGHGSVGGAIRAKETRRLFESVASRLLEWGPDIDLCNKLFWHGGVRVWNEVYSKDQAKRGMVARRDARWEKVGFRIRRPKYDDLCRVSKGLTRGMVVMCSDVKDVTEGLQE
ncbi:hypothetical protein BSKO_04648 [Bryopsis sp. KO-2023]|nr:hypothetical protein BSKO_04648 [Bryopsis sp. KO-2023]